MPANEPPTKNAATRRRDNARTLRRNATPFERKLWRHLRDEQLAGFKFRRQYPLGHYIVDFVCLEARLIVELDGDHHDLRQDGTERAMRGWLSKAMPCCGSAIGW